MATQTGSIDLKAQKQAHDDAEKKATNYLTDVTSDGVFVHTSDNASTSTGSGVHIGASVIRIIKAGVEYIKAWVSGNSSYVRIGAETINNVTQGNVLVDQDSVDIRKGTEVLSTFTANGASLGKNSDSAEIGMCNDQFKITAEEASEDFFRANIYTHDIPEYPIQALSIEVSKTNDDNVARSETSYVTQVENTEHSLASTQVKHQVDLAKDGKSGNAYVDAKSSIFKEGTYERTGSYVQMYANSATYNSTASEIVSEACLTVSAGGAGTAQEGLIDLGGNVYAFSGKNIKVLWTGGYYMTSSHIANLSDTVSNQLNGIVLVWSAYANSAAQNYDWSYYFVPKWHVALHAGRSVDILMMNNTIASNVMCRKLVYVHDNKIVGNDNNTATGTGYANNAKVLRAVIGV